MNPLLERCPSQHLLAAAAMTLLLLLANPVAHAAPGAHGPNGEHLDGSPTMHAASALPRVEAKSEAFELVAELRAGELSIFVDRYDTNEAVLGARLEVESGPLTAVATFRAEQGDYVVTDAAMLKALAGPGEHGLVFTLVAGQDSDLLDGTLVGGAGGAAATRAHGHGQGGDRHVHDHELERAAWIGAGVATLGLIGGVAWWRRRRRVDGKL
jgi:hypothetical protein